MKTNLSVRDKMNKLGELWKKLDPKIKNDYKEKAKIEKIRY